VVRSVMVRLKSSPGRKPIELLRNVRQLIPLSVFDEELRANGMRDEMEMENVERTIEDECATPRGKFGAKLKTTVGNQDVYDILIEDFLSKQGPRGKKVSAKVTKMLATRAEALTKKWKKTRLEAELIKPSNTEEVQVENPCKRAKITPECIQHKEAVAEVKKKRTVATTREVRKVVKKSEKGQVPARVQPKRAVKKAKNNQE
jgi:hypothetical protein